LEVEQVRPLLLAIVSRLGKADVPRCLRLLVGCSVRFLIVGNAGGGTIEKYYAELGKEVRDGLITKPKDLLAALKKVVPGDAQFYQEFAHASVGKSYLGRYYLSAMQQKVDDVDQPEYVPNDDQGDVTLEHVMPQAASQHWTHVDDDMRRLWSRRIGNLALLSKDQNALAAGDTIKAKAGILGASQFSLTAEFKKVKEWGPNEIAKRQERLAEIAVTTWPLHA
jgi:hypothetical protein